MALSNIALVSLPQAKNYLRVDAAASLHISAEFIGVGDGADKTFSLDHTPIEGSLKLYVDNTLQVEITDFSISGADITFVTAPVLDKGITADYDYVAGDDTFESYDDDILETLIAAATKKAEDYTGRAFIQREVIETRIGDGKKTLKLYRMPIASVDSITIDGSDLDSWSERLSIGRIYHSVVWEANAEIVVTYTAGYGDRAATQALIPDAVTAVLLIISDLYEKRGDKVDSESISGLGSTSYKLPSRAMELLNPLSLNIL